MCCASHYIITKHVLTFISKHFVCLCVCMCNESKPNLPPLYTTAAEAHVEAEREVVVAFPGEQVHGLDLVTLAYLD